MVKETRKQRVLPWVYSVLLHAAFLVLIGLSLHFSTSTLPSLGGTGKVARPVQATVVDQKLINQQMTMLRHRAKQKREAQQKLEQQAQAAKTEREQEQQKLTQLKQQQATAQQALNAKLAQLQKQAKAEKAQKAHIAKLKAEAAAQAKKRQDAENAKRRAELQREIAVEQGALNARRASLLSQWTALVKQKVQGNWNEPANTPTDLSCKVQVDQVPGGTVANAKIISCNGNEAVRQSVVTAVLRSSPLPPPPEPSLFQREFILNFTPQSNAGH